MTRTAKLLMLASCLMFWFIPTVEAFKYDDHLVLLVLHEAEDQPFPGMVAVAGVVLDRVKDDRWPETLKRVIYQPAQCTDMGVHLRNRHDRRANSTEKGRVGTDGVRTVIVWWWAIQ